MFSLGFQELVLLTTISLVVCLPFWFWGYRIAVFFGFGQVAITAVFVLTGDLGLVSLMDIAMIAFLAWAAHRRLLWGAYGLAAYALITVLIKNLSGIQAPWLVPLSVYLVGAIFLHRTKRREQSPAWEGKEA